MRKTLSWAVRVALAAAVGLAIAALAEDTGTPTATQTPANSTPGRTREAPHHGSLEPSAAPVSVSPASAGSCANEGWRVYSNPKFSSQKSCELWVRRHVAPSPALGVTPPEKNSGSTEVRTAIPFLT